jgi:hypothetical protein
MYAQTQAYPYAAALDAGVDRTATNPFSIAAEAGKAAIWPGMVAAKTVGEQVEVATADTQRAFGLFANFVGGELDELGDRTEVGVWRGAGSVFEVLAPVFVDTGMAAAAAAEDGAGANEVYLSANTDGRLELDTDADPYTTAHRAAARLVRRLSDKAIIVELLV